MSMSIDCVVVGAGVVGLAVARAMALRGLETIVLESATLIGSETSSRNSEVIHAGIYYPKDSLKARLCVDGRQRLYRYCADRGVAHRRCGKFIVATSPDQLPGLQDVRRKALANGVDDLVELPLAQVRELEPALRCAGVLNSPSTGIVDSHGLMLALQGDLEAAGGMIAFASPLQAARVEDGGFSLEVGGAEPMTVRARVLINSAGLHASTVARRIDGLAAEHVPPTLYAKGSYFALAGRAPFSRLIYPMPQAAGLGVHLTIDLGGQARFGPDVEWVDGIDYEVDPRRADGFYQEIREYWPELPDGALAPAYAGIRPKLQRPGEAARDFLFQGPADHGVAGLVNLFGIESPGLTSSLAIGEHVARMLMPDAADPDARA
ncbi:MAG: NAD(P)/FAD-dependent oxidoreductase [Burkholderiaceae bacterium]